MKRTILGTFILAVIVAAGTLGAVAATDEVDQGAQVPNLCMEAVDSASMRVVSTGHTLSAHQEPTEVVANEAGTCDVQFIRRMHSPIREARFYWNEEEVIIVPGPHVIGIGHIYTFTLVVRADGSVMVNVGEPERQLWWYGSKIGYHTLSKGDAYFSPECIEASKDPEYLKSHKPGTGPACIARTYLKPCNNCPVEVIE